MTTRTQADRLAAVGTAPSANSEIVRKRLDEDCLLHGQLHPSIAERLARVRELPVSAVANLQAVDRDESGAWMVWQFVEGQTLEQYLHQTHSPTELDQLYRQLQLAVGAMHAHGIVHGAVHERNVIIDTHGRVRLTHVSPLLWSDPAQDLAALDRLAKRMGAGLRASVEGADQDISAERRFRLWAYAAVVGAILLGLVMFAGILWYIRA